MKRIKTGLIVILVFFLSSMLFAGEGGKWTLEPAAGDKDKGIIFNVSSILLDIQSCQGGFGFKVGGEKMAFRSVVDLLLYNGLDTVSLALGMSLEKHFIPGSISPYWGGLINVGFNSIKTEVDDDNWTQVIAIPLSAGGLFGVEVFIFDFLSVFAEYNLTFTVNVNVDKNCVAGVVDSEGSYDYNLGIGLGNDSRIGVIIYFQRRK